MSVQTGRPRPVVTKHRADRTKTRVVELFQRGTPGSGSFIKVMIKLKRGARLPGSGQLRSDFDAANAVRLKPKLARQLGILAGWPPESSGAGAIVVAIEEILKKWTVLEQLNEFPANPAKELNEYCSTIMEAWMLLLGARLMLPPRLRAQLALFGNGDGTDPCQPAS